MSETPPPKLKDINTKEIKTELYTYKIGLESITFLYFFDIETEAMCMYRKSDKKLVSDSGFFVEQGFM